MKRIINLVGIVFLLTANALFADETEILSKAARFSQQKEYAAALELLDNGLKQYGETEGLLAAKAQALLDLGRPGEALPVAVRRVEAAERKSPWHCIAVMDICLKLGDLDGAFTWLGRATERGFLDYSELAGAEYAALRKDPRYAPILASIQARIGINRPARDFTVTLLSGRTLRLSDQKGKVVLIDFWATWCAPCREGIAHLKEYYDQFKGRGFEIVGISLDAERAKVDDYLAKEKLKWAIAFSGQAWKDPIALQYSVNLIPSYWLVDRKGTLRDFGIHLRDKDDMRRAIEKLLSEK
jgi:peroxiredoxin